MGQNAPEAYKGFELWWNSFRFKMKMYSYLSKFILCVHAVIILGWFYSNNKLLLSAVGGYILKAFKFFVWPDWGYLKRVASFLGNSLFEITLYSSPIWFFGFLLVLFFKRLGDKDKKTIQLSGVKIINILDLVKMTSGKESSITIFVAKSIEEMTVLSIAQVKKLWKKRLKIPREIETRHFLMIGKSGSGKSTLISQIVASIRKNGGRGIVHDPHCEYLTRFYDEKTDSIFNPLDVRSRGWTIFNDIKTEMDFSLIASILIPETKHGDAIWVQGARSLFEGILGTMNEVGGDNLTNKRLWEIIEMGPDGLARYLKSSNYGLYAGRTYLSDPKGKMAQSFIAVMNANLAGLKYFDDGDFSVTSFLQKNDPGMIFLTNRADIKEVIKPYTSLFVELIGMKLLSLRNDLDRRFYIILDEIGALQRLKTIERLGVEIRKKGGVLIVGTQDFGQLDEVYGKNIRSSISNSCGNKFFFKITDEQTADSLSKMIGEWEFSEATEMVSGGIVDNRDGFTYSRHRRTERKILPSNIMGLKTLQAYIKLEDYDYALAQIIPVDYKNESEVKEFVMKENLNLGSLLANKEIIEIKEETRESGKRVGEIDMDQELSEDHEVGINF